MRMHMSLIPASSHATHAEIYFEGACAIVTFLLAGRLMEARTRYHSGDALRSLLELGAKDAILVEGSGSERTYRTIPAAELRVGDLFQVRPGDKVATDCVVEEGSSALDTSLMTGESLPREVSPGSAVTGGTLNTSGALIVRATAVGSGTQLAHIGQMITEAFPSDFGGMAHCGSWRSKRNHGGRCSVGCCLPLRSWSGYSDRTPCWFR